MDPETLIQLQEIAQTTSTDGWATQLPAVIIQVVLFLVVLLGAARKVLADIGKLVNRLMDVDSDQRKLDREHQGQMLHRVITAFEETVAADRRLTDARVDTLSIQIELLKEELRTSLAGANVKLEELKRAVDRLSRLVQETHSHPATNHDLIVAAAK